MLFEFSVLNTLFMVYLRSLHFCLQLICTFLNLLCFFCAQKRGALVTSVASVHLWPDPSPKCANTYSSPIRVHSVGVLAELVKD